MSETPKTHEEMSNVAARVTRQVESLLDEAQPVISRVSHLVKEELNGLSDSGKGALSEAKNKLGKEVQHVRISTEHIIQHDPIRSVLVAAGTGAVAALMVSWLLRSRTQ